MVGVEKKAATNAYDWRAQEPALNAQLSAADADVQQKTDAAARGEQWLQAAEADYAAGAPEREKREGQAGVYKEKERSWNAAYLRGESDYQTKLEQVRNQYEQEAFKNVDLTRSADELIGDLERGLAKGDKALVTLISKELSKRGSSDALFEKFGIKEGGKAGLKRYTEEVLQGRAGVDGDYAMKTALRMAASEADKGNIGFKGAVKADPITREVKWQTDNDMAKSAASSMQGKTVRSVIDSTSPGALTRKRADGTVQLSPQAMGFLSKLNSNTASLKKIINDGNMKPEMLQALHSQLAELRRLEASGRLKKDFVDLIETEGAKVPPAVATDPGKVAQQMYAAIYPPAPGGTP